MQIPSRLLKKVESASIITGQEVIGALLSLAANKCFLSHSLLCLYSLANAEIVWRSQTYACQIRSLLTLC